MVESLKQKTGKMMVTDWQMANTWWGCYTILSQLLWLEIFTHKLKINEVVSKEDKGLYDQKY